MGFQKAVKHESKLRLAIAGPSGSGKTYTALAIGTALAGNGRVAVVDTEHGSASKYADLFDFDVMNLDAPFHPHRYAVAIREAAAAGYDVVVLDSLSHAWFATGGVLDIVDEAAKRSKSQNTYMAWKEGTPVQNELIESITSASIHVIGTMRSKTEYALVTNSNGKQAPQKMGMAPVQRDGFEYEFDVMFDMDIGNNAIVTKSRCIALTGGVFHNPGADVAAILRDWLHGVAVDATTSEVVETTHTHIEGYAIGDAVTVAGKTGVKTGNVIGLDFDKAMVQVAIDGNGALWLKPDKLSKVEPVQPDYARIADEASTEDTY
jgi:KaiC/GvpD/RAD55 family RecA-like ATPase